jgi:hypothetical protein
VNLAVEPSFTLLGLRSTAKIHDVENNHSVMFVYNYSSRTNRVSRTVNLAVEPSFTLLELRSTAKIHDAENNHSEVFMHNLS